SADLMMAEALATRLELDEARNRLDLRRRRASDRNTQVSGCDRTINHTLRTVDGPSSGFYYFQKSASSAYKRLLGKPEFLNVALPTPLDVMASGKSLTHRS